MQKPNWNVSLYNQKHNFVYQYGESLVTLLGPRPGERILDLGCGSGELTGEIGKVTGQVIGIDQSQEMIDAASQRFDALEFYVKDAVDFDFEQPFDAIFSNAVLHWVLDKEAAIDCMHRNLKEGGRIAIEFGGKGNVQTILEQVRKSLGRRGHYAQSKIMPWYFPSIGAYASLLEKAGFRVVEAHHFDRMTELADASSGIIDWLSMFGSAFFKGLPPEEQMEIMEEVQESLRSELLIEGKWYADYKRLRLKAIKS